MPDSTHSNSNGFVDLDNARVDEQRQVMKEIIEDGVCPFCTEHLKKYHPGPWVKIGQYWIVSKNRWPYDNTAHHLLLIYKEHVQSLSEVTPDAGKELITLAAELERELQIPGGGLIMRFGDTNYSAGSVNHLHAQLIMPDIGRAGFKPVRVKLGKDQA